ncbi:MAG: KEOPS complex subunit Pcc1, partial [Thermoplasmata archaeon]
MTDPSGWEGIIEIDRPMAGAADRLAAALRPESSREVPRATARVDRVGPDTVRLTLTARDTGALRAALNTYHGWISLA